MFLDIFALVVIALLIAVVIRIRLLLHVVSGDWQLREGNNYVSPQLIDTMQIRTDWGELLTTPEKPESTNK